MTATHIDPFAPGDSPQHPANWTPEPVALSVQDAIADMYQWRRDHLAMATEANADIPADELEGRHERYGDYLEEHGLDDEGLPDTPFVPFPELLRRAVFTDEGLDDEQVDEWKALFEQHSTDDERDPAWVEGVLPGLDELRARATVAEASARAAEQTAPQEMPTAPKGNALKEDWVEYALAVSKLRGEDLTEVEAEAMSVSALKAAYKPQAD